MFLDAPVGRSVITVSATDNDKNANLVYRFIEPKIGFDTQSNQVAPTTGDFKVNYTRIIGNFETCSFKEKTLQTILNVLPIGRHINLHICSEIVQYNYLGFHIFWISLVTL